MKLHGLNRKDEIKPREVAITPRTQNPQWREQDQLRELSSREAYGGSINVYMHTYWDETTLALTR